MCCKITKYLNKFFLKVLKTYLLFYMYECLPAYMYHVYMPGVLRAQKLVLGSPQLESPRVGSHQVGPLQEQKHVVNH